MRNMITDIRDFYEKGEVVLYITQSGDKSLYTLTGFMADNKVKVERYTSPMAAPQSKGATKSFTCVPDKIMKLWIQPKDKIIDTGDSFKPGKVEGYEVIKQGDKYVNHVIVSYSDSTEAFINLDDAARRFMLVPETFEA